MGHDHEICWLLWTAHSLSIGLSDEISKQLSVYPNPLVALMGMHARALGLISPTIDIAPWSDRVNVSSLDEEWWMFSYECAVKNWIAGKIDWTTIQDTIFDRMRKAQVTFYLSGAKSQEVAQLETDKPAIPSKLFAYELEEEEAEA
jgi:hypothetical protein